MTSGFPRRTCKSELFPDSVLRECKYCSGTFVDGDLNLHLGGNSFLRCLFQRQASHPRAIELVFAGVSKVALTPDAHNPIEEAHVRLEDDGLVWFEGCQIEGTANLVRAEALYFREVDDWVGLRERYTAALESDVHYYDPEPSLRASTAIRTKRTL